MKKTIATFITAAFALSVPVMASEISTDAIRISASQASLEGVALKGTENESPITYDEKDDCILGLGEYSNAIYEIPELEEGSYDIYLELSKGSSAFVCGSCPVTVSVNGGDLHIPSIPVSSCAMDQMGMDGEPTYQNDTGLFLVDEDISLQTGDKISIGGVPGFEFSYNDSYSSSMPAIGDLVIAKSGEEVEQGYEGKTFTVTEEETDPADPLSGLNIAWLGSSVTYGQGAGGYSMADAISANHENTNCYKYAISGTTLSNAKTEHTLPIHGDEDHGSYVWRMEQLDKNQQYDLFIVQLSTNDATAGISMGEISADQNLENQDKSTVIGAMEYIIAYVRDTWNCPVMFYTGTKYDSKQYGEMVNVLLELKEKWDIGVIDLWNNEEMNDIDDELYHTYMKEDGIHPLRDGYELWWTPAFEEAIIDYLTK